MDGNCPLCGHKVLSEAPNGPGWYCASVFCTFDDENAENFEAQFFQPSALRG